MHKPTVKTAFFLLLLICGVSELMADTGRYRLSWRDNPSTTMTIGFEFSAGREAYVALGEQFGGTDPSAYPIHMSPAQTIIAQGMRTCFVRLKGLKPATVYHFIVVDDLGISRPMSFETAPDRLDHRLSFIAGGDSRNHREARQNSNKLVAKLRPHAVFFNGDMTNMDSPEEWKAWLDDWQLTISADGRCYPIIPARGNHERDNRSITELFDMAAPGLYYSTHFAGGLMSLYTLNSMIPVQGPQLNWLKGDLNQNQQTIWKMVQYHNSMRPHTARKLDRDDLVKFWAPVFYQHKVDLVIESDAHVAKQTYPIRPGGGLDADEGFVRDDAKGTVYIGEGGWGAPLRDNNDDKSWTQASGRFNQIKWIWVSASQMEVRTIKTDGSRNAAAVSASDRFRVPRGLDLWQPIGQEALIIRKGGNAPMAQAAPQNTPPDRRPGNRPKQQPSIGKPGMTPNSPPAAPVTKSAGILRPNSEYDVQVEFVTTQPGPVEIIVIASDMRLFHKKTLPVRGPGPYREKIDLPEIPRGIKWQLIIKSRGKVIQKYDLHN